LWGDNPPYHHPVFVLTHHKRVPVTMQGGTTFHFVTDGIKDALDRAFEAAKGQDVRLGGGVSAIQQYLAAGLVDELHLAISPVLLGQGERLFDKVDSLASEYEVSRVVPSPKVTHVHLTRKAR
jgi:dihydrofolate reductase